MGDNWHVRTRSRLKEMWNRNWSNWPAPTIGRYHWTLQPLADEIVVLDLVDSISTDMVRQALKKTYIQPWIVQSRGIPPKANAEFVWRMEDVIQTYMLPYDPIWPVVCFDEASSQLFDEVRPPQPARHGSPALVDYEYERKGVCCQIMMCEPLRGWRHITVTDRRPRQDYAHRIRDLVDR
jgi:hypothetical protein